MGQSSRLSRQLGGRPALVSPAAVSFCNVFFGCVVLGCLWNASLTKRKKGVSHVLAAVLPSLPVLALAAMEIIEALL